MWICCSKWVIVLCACGLLDKCGIRMFSIPVFLNVTWIKSPVLVFYPSFPGGWWDKNVKMNGFIQVNALAAWFYWDIWNCFRSFIQFLFSFAGISKRGGRVLSQLYSETDTLPFKKRLKLPQRFKDSTSTILMPYSRKTVRHSFMRS